MSTFTGTPGPDNFAGGAGADTFNFAPADLSSADTVNGGTGSAIDSLVFTSAGTVAATAFQNVSHIEAVILANGTNSVTLTDALVGSADDNGVLYVNGGTGNDTVDASAVTTASNRVFFTANTGNDTLTGGAGSDTFYFTAADLTSADTVNGGTGSSVDRIVLTTAGGIASAALQNISHIEQIWLADGGINTINISDTLVGTADDSHILSIVGGSGDDSVNASAVTTATNRVYITAGSGIDTLRGGAGLDVFYFTAADLSGDTVDGGGGGSTDVIAFTTAGTIGIAAFQNVTRIEQLVLANGSNNLTLTDALVGSSDIGHILTVNGGAGDDVINASAVTTAADRVYFIPASGSDTLTGGAGADDFFFTAADLSSSDTVNGGVGSSIDTIVFTTAGTIAASALQNVSHVEQIVLANGTNNLVLSDALVGTADDNHIFMVTGTAGDDTVDAGSVTTAANRVFVTAGAGTDTLTGGAGSDTFYFTAADLTSADTIDGGAGASSADRIVFTSAGTVGATAFQNVSHIEQVMLANGTNSLALPDNLLASADGQFNVAGGAGADTFLISSAAMTPAVTLNGGAGSAIDAIVLTTAGVLAANAFQSSSHIEHIVLADGTNSITLGNLWSTTDDNQGITVWGGAGNDTINGYDGTGAGGITGQHVTIYAGSGADTLTGTVWGGSTFYFAAADLTSADAVTGGLSNGAGAADRLVLTTAGTVSASAFQNVTHVENLYLANGTNNISLANNMVLTADPYAVSPAHYYGFAVYGGSGDDTIDASTVTGGNAVFVYFTAGAGNDTLIGGGEADTFYFAPSDLTSVDTVSGGPSDLGAARDVLQLTGPGVLAADALQNVSHVEQINLATSGTNSITLSDAVVASSDSNHIMTVGSGAGNDTIDASAVTTAANAVVFASGAGIDTLTGGAGADTFDFKAADLTSDDTVYGGTGASLDTLALTASGTLASDALQNVSHIENIVVQNNANVGITLTDALIASADDGQVLTINGAAGAETVDASAISVASGHVVFTGHSGADNFTAGIETDTIVYAGPTDSNARAYDTITNFDFGTDRFDLPSYAGAITQIESTRTAQLDSGTNFITEIANAMAGLGANHAGLVTATSGTLSGETFLVVDLNGVAGYGYSNDLIMHLVSPTGTLATTDFI